MNQRPEWMQKMIRDRRKKFPVRSQPRQTDFDTDFFVRLGALIAGIYLALLFFRQGDALFVFPGVISILFAVYLGLSILNQDLPGNEKSWIKWLSVAFVGIALIGTMTSVAVAGSADFVDWLQNDTAVAQRSAADIQDGATIDFTVTDVLVDGEVEITAEVTDSTISEVKLNIDPPVDDECIIADSAQGGGWKWDSCPGAGGGDSVQVDGVNATDVNLVSGTGVDIAFDAGPAPDTATFDIDTTELGNITFGSGAGLAHTFDASGGTDPVVTYGNGTVVITAGTTIDSDLAANIVDAIGEIDASIRSGLDITLITGTSGGAGNCVEWNADGDVIDSGSSCGAGAGDSSEVEDGDNVGTFSTIDTTARFEDSADINFALVDGGPGGPDEITGTIRANSIALATDTTGAYVATIADSGNTNVTVAGSGGENATVTLDVIDVNCTDCLNATEIADIYVLVAGDTMVGNLNMDDGVTDTPRVLFTPAAGTVWELFVEDTDDDLQIGPNTGVAENLDIVNAGAGTVNLVIDSLATGGASECVQTDTSGVLSNTGGACGGGSIDLQGAYDNEVAPALITLTNALGGIIFDGDAELTEPTFTVRDDGGSVGILVDNDDEGGNEASPPIRIANSTAGAGDTQFSFIVTATDELEIRGDDDAADLTIEADGDLDLAANLTCSSCIDLGGGSAGAYVATIADAGSTTIAVVGSGGETAAVTLDAIDLNCTDCIGATEITDIYVLVAGDVMTGNLDFDDGTTDSPRVLFRPQAGTLWNLYVADSDDDLQIEVDTGVAENLDIVNVGAGTINVVIDSLATGGANECVQVDTNGVLSNTGGACGGGSIDLQGAYDNEAAPALITETDATGGLIFEGDAEVTNPNLTLRDSTANKIGLLLDNDDEAAAENSPILRLANSTVAAGDIQFSIVVTATDLEIRGDDDAADVTIEADGDLNLAANIVCTDCVGDTDVSDTITVGNAGTVDPDAITCDVVDDNLISEDCFGDVLDAGEIEDIFLFNNGDATTGDIDYNDTVGDSPKATFTPATGTAWDIFTEDTADDLQIEADSASTEGLDIVNTGAGTVVVTIDSLGTGGAAECVQADTNGLLSITGSSCGAGAGDVTAVGPGHPTGETFTNGVASTGSVMFVWEGTGIDANDLSINAPANPTVNQTFTFPDDNIADDDLLLGSGAGTFTYTALVDSDGATQKLQYDVTTNAFSAGTDDDVPESGDFAAATDLDAAGAISCTDCLNATEIEDIYVLIAGDVITGSLDFDDGTTDSPRVLFRVQTGTLWNIYAEDTDDDLQIEVDSGVEEIVDFNNIGAGSVSITIDGTYTGTNVTSGADPGHTHTTASVSGLDISDDLNLTCGTNCTLAGDEISVDDVFVLVAGDVMTGNLDLDDGITDSPRILFRVQVGTLWNIYAEDTDDDLQIEVNTGVDENLDIVNTGAGTIDVTIDSLATGGANECIEADTNGLLVLTGGLCGTSSGDITDVGPGYADGAAFTDGVVSTGSIMLVWEGTGLDTNELTISAPANPAVDQLFTFPDDQLADDDLIVANGAGTFEYKALTDCDGANINRLQYDTTANVFSCDTDPVAAGEYAAASIDGDDIATSLAGDHLTLTAASPDTLDLDANVTNHIVSMILTDPTTADDALLQHKFASTVTIVRVSCDTDVATSTVTIQFDERVETTPNTSGTDVMTAVLVCDTNNQATTSFANAGIAADAPFSMDIDATANSPTVVRVHIEYTIDD